MKTLETECLILRPFEENDFKAVHAYASVTENVQYKEIPCNNYQYAAVLKSSKKLIGACNLAILSDGEVEIGWILHRDYWKQGFGTEMGNRILEFGFNELGLHRIIAHCDTENYGSYRVMEHIGMRRKGLPASCASHSCTWDEKGIDHQQPYQHSFKAYL